MPSLDQIDRQSFNAGPSPIEGESRAVELQPGRATGSTLPSAPVLSLNGEWEMVEGGEESDRLGGHWTNTVPATVPGSVHGALEKAGRIPDPKFGRNDAIAMEQSHKTWWLRTRFARPQGTGHRLAFDGVAISCTVYLNGQKLGEHNGMFGGPFFDVSSLLKDQNELVVKLDPAGHGDSTSTWKDNNSWKKTVVFNNVYGWHYSKIPSLGIWQSVRIESTSPVKMLNPFIATTDALAGKVKLIVDFESKMANWSGTLRGTISPENFTGESHTFELPINSSTKTVRQRIDLTIPNPKPWWPNGYGEQNLYKLSLEFVPTSATIGDRFKSTFGLRTIEMAPLPSGEKSDVYNWTFVVNGRPIFVKGTGWCTMDSSMDFSRSRYERFLQLAKDENCQMVRAWGSGMPETEDFYDLCDRFGLMVMQEWPTAWNSHETQPFGALEETVRLSTLRTRNRTSLVMWGGGNESDKPFGKAIDMMGRYAIELDGTRPFHRGEPWGGSSHNYDVWWNKQHLDHNLKMTASFFGEFGIASLPVLESVKRYLPKEEQNEWPPRDGGSLKHHTPVFNNAEDFDRLTQYSGYFSEGRTMERFILGSQVAQCVALRHTLERARTRWPECTGALLYKLNDNYPAASWATTDWYGATKLSHWFVQDAFAPIAGVVLFDSVLNEGKAVSWPVYLVDDTGALKSDWKVRVRAFDGLLALVQEKEYSGRGAVEQGRQQVGSFDLSETQTKAVPLLIVTDVESNGRSIHRTFYWVNYETKKDCLFELPKATLSLTPSNGTATVKNIGTRPAVGVLVHRPGHEDSFWSDDNAFWLDAGESKNIRVNHTDGLIVDAWNSERSPA